MAEELKPLYFCIVFSLSLIPLALAADENQFIYQGFNVEPQLYRQGLAAIRNGLLQLTGSDGERLEGYAFYPLPLKFNTSSSETMSFSTNFVFAIVPEPESPNFGGNGMAFVMSPTIDLSKVVSGAYLGIFNSTNNVNFTNNIFAVELDTVENPEFHDIDGNHVGIDLSSLISNEFAPAAYFSDKEKKFKSFLLESGNPIQIWIDYNGAEKFLNVTLAPTTIPKPKRPLLSTSLDLSQILLNTTYVGFSASTRTRRTNHYVLGWSFNKSGRAQDLNISNLPSLPLLSPPPAKGKMEPRLIIIVIIVAVVVVLITIGAAVYVVRRKKYEEVYEDWERQYGPQRFSYKDLYEATKGFNDKEVIGKGGSGKVYRGVLPSNVQIAVKRVTRDSKEGMKEFVAEVVSMERLRHRNLVKLRGYCRLRGEFLLVYDYMPNGSLDKILHSNTRPNLNWFQRFRIIKGVASGLLYLHEEGEQVVLHRDVKPGNVLLDNDLNGRLGDFGLARLYDRGSTLQTTKVVGTFGYIAPELMKIGKASTSTDVYAFGVLLLEVACGRRPIEQEGLQETADLVDWVTDCWKRRAILDVSDPRLEGIYTEEQMELVLKLGLFCSHPNPAARPSMRQVMQYLDGQVILPDISTEIKEASGVEMLFSSLTGNNANQSCSSTTDSILRIGR